MFPTKKLFALFTVLTAALVVAAQCGAALPVEESAAKGVSKTDVRTEAEEHEHDEAEQDKAGEEQKHPEEDEEAHEHSEELNAADLGPVGLAEGERLQVVATTNIIGDLVRNVAGDAVELAVLLPTGADPHTFEPAPQDAAAVADAHAVFANGLGFEAFLENLIENAGGEAAVIPVANGVEIREFEPGEAHEHDEAEQEKGREAEETDEHEEDEHHHGRLDPHAWLNPLNAIIYVHNIEAALSALDPDNADIYAENAEAYIEQLQALDGWAQEQIETIPAGQREMVTDHDAFGYYADRYGLEVVGIIIPSYSTAAEPSAQQMAALERAIAAYDAPAIFVGATVNPVLAERIARDTNTELVPLYTGSLGPEGSGADNYIDYIRYNTAAIVEALQE